jgi:hypothetical protein
MHTSGLGTVGVCSIAIGTRRRLRGSGHCPHQVELFVLKTIIEKDRDVVECCAECILDQDTGFEVEIQRENYETTSRKEEDRSELRGAGQ